MRMPHKLHIEKHGVNVFLPLGKNALSILAFSVNGEPEVCVAANGVCVFRAQLQLRTFLLYQQFTCAAIMGVMFLAGLFDRLWLGAGLVEKNEKKDLLYFANVVLY